MALLVSVRRIPGVRTMELAAGVGGGCLAVLRGGQLDIVGLGRAHVRGVPYACACVVLGACTAADSIAEAWPEGAHVRGVPGACVFCVWCMHSSRQQC